MRYQILKSFAGSQDGRFCDHFEAGTEAELSDYLAGIVVPAGWAKPVQVSIENKAIVSDGANHARPAVRRRKSGTPIGAGFAPALDEQKTEG